MFTKRRNVIPVFFEMLGRAIGLNTAVKYLEVWEHVNQALVKAGGYVGGPRASKGEILSSVARKVGR